MMSAPRSVAILGASADRSKYGNKSVRAHARQGYEVFPVNLRDTLIEGLAAYPSLDDVPCDHLGRISVYLPPAVALRVLDEIAAKPHDELFFNPGSDSPEVIEKARGLGLSPIQACSIVDVGEDPADFESA
jgi:hypothetical protein